MTDDTGEVPFRALTPETMLDAVERFGGRCDGRFLALNSYENRVFRIGLEDTEPVVAKFYRPGRWRDEQILEEHAFAHELAAFEIPVAAPLRDAAGATLIEHAGFKVALFPMLAGEWPDLDRCGRLRWLGRFLGRIHGVGRTRPFQYRAALDVERFGETPARFLIESEFVAEDVRLAYAQTTRHLLAQVSQRFELVPAFQLRVHGDCHPGNVLWSDAGPAFVDLDDACNGPAVQDLWMLLSGDSHEQRAQLEELLAGYEVFTDFDRREIDLIEALRALRLIHYAGWIARRWHDPAFPQAFPWFGTRSYWSGHVDDLRQQLEVLANGIG